MARCEKLRGKKEFQKSWGKLSFWSWKEPVYPENGFFVKKYNRFLEYSGHRAMKIITSEWLKSHGIESNYVRIERGDVHVADARSQFKNRFTASRLEQIRLFVEDDPVKARKLARVCEFVYLVVHPYNADVDQIQPRNVIRVQTLDEVRKHVRDVL